MLDQQSLQGMSVLATVQAVHADDGERAAASSHFPQLIESPWCSRASKPMSLLASP